MTDRHRCAVLADARRVLDLWRLLDPEVAPASRQAMAHAIDDYTRHLLTTEAVYGEEYGDDHVTLDDRLRTLDTAVELMQGQLAEVLALLKEQRHA